MATDLDMLRDEAIEYATRLTASDVRAELHVYPGALHVFDLDTLGLNSALTQQAMADYIGALKRAFAGADNPAAR